MTPRTAWVCRPCLAPLGEVEIKSIGNFRHRTCSVCGRTAEPGAVELVDMAIANRAHAALCERLESERAAGRAS